MTDASSLITQTEEFVKQAFIQNPHYSFDDWTVMYNHSVMVKDIVLEITNEIVCDKEAIAIGALLHDIGKTYKTDLETLHTEHESFNLLVSENFFENLCPLLPVVRPPRAGRSDPPRADFNRNSGFNIEFLQ